MEYSLQNVFPGVRIIRLVKIKIEMIRVIEIPVYLEGVSQQSHETIRILHFVETISDEITFQLLWR